MSKIIQTITPTGKINTKINTPKFTKSIAPFTMLNVGCVAAIITSPDVSNVKNPVGNRIAATRMMKSIFTLNDCPFRENTTHE